MSHFLKISTLLFCTLLIPEVSYAYIDPGAGSQIVQIFIAALVGGLFAFKSGWFRVKMFFNSFRKDSKIPESNDRQL